MKKFLSILLVVTLMMYIVPIGLMSITASAEEYTSGYYTYTVSNGEATITRCYQYLSGDITVPSNLGGYPVTSIGNGAFYNCVELTSITIPNSVESIDGYAFWNCNRLASITIPNSVESIGWNAFHKCSSLESISIPDSVTSIGSWAFYDCTSLASITISDNMQSIGGLAFYNTAYYNNSSNWENKVLYICNHLIDAQTNIYGTYIVKEDTKIIADKAFDACISLESISIPDSVTSIGEKAFFYCDSLTSITIPNSVTSIGEDAFNDCYSLTSITIPNSVTSIGETMFTRCRSLTCITVDANNQYYSSVDGVLFNKNKTMLVCYPAGKKTSATYTIPNSVTSIGKYAFYDCDSLTSITIPNSVTSIGIWAFYDCAKLEEVWYTGSKNDRNNIVFNDSDSKLTNATWHYNTCDSNSHIYDGECDSNCNKCEWVRTVTQSHSYDNACDSICNVCGYTRPTPHYFKWVIDKQETCGESGLKHEECTVCHAKRNENTVISAIGNHTYDNECDTQCNVCEAIRTITHKYDNECDTDCNVCGYIRSTTHSYESDNDLICNICKYSRTPNKPTAATIRAISIELEIVDGCEYSIDGITWQKEPLFVNLIPETEYSFYQRVKETASAKVSEKSEPLIIKTPKAYTITYDAEGGTDAPQLQHKDLGVDITLTNDKPIREGYTFIGWSTSKKGKVEFESGATYQKDKDIVLYAIWRLSCDNCDGTGNHKGSTTCTVCAGAGGTSTKCTNCNGSGHTGYKPSTTICNGCLGSGTVIAKVTCSSCSGSGSFRSCGFCGSRLSSGQSKCYSCSNGFTKYTTCSSCNGKGYKYDSGSSTCGSCGGSGQKTTNVPISCHSCGGDGIHTVDCGNCVNGKIETLNNCETCLGKGYKLNSTEAPKAPTLLRKNHNSVTLTAVVGYGFSKDGITWQTSNIFTELSPNTTYVFYQRIAETETHYASEISEILRVITLDEPLVAIGDVNADGAINVSDLATLKKYIAVLLTETETIECYPDVDENGIVNVADLAQLKKKIAGLV